MTEVKELFREELIKMELEGSNKKEVIMELIELLYEHGVVKDKEKFFEDVWAREQVTPTGVGFGIAIPHAKSSAVVTPTVAIGKSTKGVDFEAIDGKPVHLVFLIGVPENAPDLHLKILSSLSRRLVHEEFREALMKAKSPHEIVEILSKNIEG
ncbi:fructose PTS transporter subunit IIA [Thermococcus aggregans]|uniref:Fructose PTS transporter subunit IIA n=1 Tax=Thermococcus aggregans TaxID=110163 RepID=A0A9E7MX49_THEAG|nr:fructose PTS transporter subunit IIA [Thermococcus aggregans]USS40548.1 fructose PTS transporter subunit IIA [Thermococcus aggregans]